jgi:hypothetical protein
MIRDEVVHCWRFARDAEGLPVALDDPAPARKRLKK